LKALLFLVPFVVLFAVACAGDSATKTTAAPEATAAIKGVAPTPTPTVRPTSLPTSTNAARNPRAVDGGTLIRLGSEPTTLDPHLTTDAASSIYIVEIFGGLMTIDKNLEISGDLAEDWSVSDDGSNYTFRLNRDARFHDGRRVTARDVKWSLERAVDPATEAPTVDVFLGDIVGVSERLAGAAGGISGVQVIDDRTITIDIDGPKAYFLSKLTYPTSFVLDQNNVVGNPDWTTEPNGTGPFKLTEYEPGQVLLLSRFQDYHLGPAKLDEVRIILSGGSSLLMFENSEIHATGRGAIGLETALDPANPLSDLVVVGPPRFDVDYFGMNVTEPPFDDPKVRQAFNYAVDRQTLSRVLLDDSVVPATGILPPGFPGFNPNLEGYEFDPLKARQLLEESKYGDDLANMPQITLTLPGSFGSPISPVVEAILTMWETNLGVRMDLLQTNWAIFLQDLQERRFQMFGGLGWIADYPDPENFLDVLFHGESSNNHMDYANSEVDLILERARIERDEDARFDLYHQAEELIVADAPWVSLWHNRGDYALAKPFVNDYFLFPLVIPRFKYVYFTE
jgi:oligopeptide transport system substrate-binding protein